MRRHVFITQREACMSQNSFDIVFTGVIVPGNDPARVKANFAALFKTEVAKVEPLFSGKRFVIKKGLDEATALKYQKALREAGAIVHMEPSGAATPVAAPAKPAVPPAAVQTANTPAPSTPESGGLNATIDPPGVVLIEPEQVTPPDIDISHLHMDEPGVTLVPPADVPALDVNLNGMSMAEPGVVLIEPVTVPDLDVDTSAMTLAEPGVQLVEPESLTTPDIDTSKLSLT
jgi:hypothetical protein